MKGLSSLIFSFVKSLGATDSNPEVYSISTHGQRVCKKGKKTVWVGNQRGYKTSPQQRAGCIKCRGQAKDKVSDKWCIFQTTVRLQVLWFPNSSCFVFVQRIHLEQKYSRWNCSLPLFDTLFFFSFHGWKKNVIIYFSLVRFSVEDVWFLFGGWLISLFPSSVMALHLRSLLRLLSWPYPFRWI